MLVLSGWWISLELGPIVEAMDEENHLMKVQHAIENSTSLL